MYSLSLSASFLQFNSYAEVDTFTVSSVLKCPSTFNQGNLEYRATIAGPKPHNVQKPLRWTTDIKEIFFLLYLLFIRTFFDCIATLLSPLLQCQGKPHIWHLFIKMNAFNEPTSIISVRISNNFFITNLSKLLFVNF